MARIAADTHLDHAGQVGVLVPENGVTPYEINGKTPPGHVLQHPDAPEHLPPVLVDRLDVDLPRMSVAPQPERQPSVCRPVPDTVRTRLGQPVGVVFRGPVSDQQSTLSLGCRVGETQLAPTGATDVLLRCPGIEALEVIQEQIGADEARIQKGEENATSDGRHGGGPLRSSELLPVRALFRIWFVVSPQLSTNCPMESGGLMSLT